MHLQGFTPRWVRSAAVAWTAHAAVAAGVYESELERIGNVYMLRDEPPHRLQTMKAEGMMATNVVGFRSIESVARILEVCGL